MRLIFYHRPLIFTVFFCILGVIEVPEVRAANKTVFGFNKPSEDCSSDDDDY